MNWLSAMFNVGQGIAEAAARKQMSSQPQKRGEAPCTPCQAQAKAEGLFQKHGLTRPARRARPKVG